MPRQFFLPDSGWWQAPAHDEAGAMYWLGEVERGPADPPPLVPEREQAAEAVSVEEATTGEPPGWYEDDGPHVTEDDRWNWLELHEAFFRQELVPLGEHDFDPLAYRPLGAQACSVPAQHPPPGTLIGFPGSGTHSWTELPNNWQSDNAVDIWLYPGTPVRACAAGTVSRSYGYGRLGDEASRFGGSRLHVEHAGGWVSYYAHLERITVPRGKPVRRGEVIGRSGFGNCVPHLHFGVTMGRDPRNYAAITYDRNAAPAPPQPGQEPPGVRGPRLPRTLDQSWSNVTHAIGPDRRRYKRRLATARRALKNALK